MTARWTMIVAVLAAGVGLGVALDELVRPAPPAVPERGDVGVSQQSDTLRAGRPCRPWSGLVYVRPVVDCDPPTPPGPEALAPLGAALRDLVDDAVERGAVTEVGVHVADLDTGATLDLNETARFTPASLYKVPLMMAVFEAAQRTPGLWARELVLRPGDDVSRRSYSQQRSVEHPLQIGQAYTVDAMLRQMVTESDNVAADLLGARVVDDASTFAVFTRLGLPAPQVDALEDSTTPRAFSTFLKALVDATYLGPTDSERALKLLMQTRYRRGLVAALPVTVPVAHKFGERASPLHPEAPQQLHDCGVVYRWERPYVLCVMTRGRSLEALEGVVAALSAEAWRFFMAPR